VKKIALTLILSTCFYMPASAITGLGIGIHAGQTTSYDYETLNDAVLAISDAMENMVWPNERLSTEEFSEKLTSIGAHFKIGTLPVIDFIGFIDYAWKKKDMGHTVELRVSDFTYGITAIKKIGVTMIKPYAGAGIAFHTVVYNLESGYGNLTLPPLPDDETKMGYHLVGGVELDFPVFPLAPYAEGRYNIITTTDKSTKYLLLSLGLTMNF